MQSAASFFSQPFGAKTSELLLDSFHLLHPLEAKLNHDDEAKAKKRIVLS